MALSVLGVGSNLDLESIVTKLLTVEHLPLDQLASKTAATTTRISAFGTVKGQLSALQAAAKAMTDAKLGVMKVGLDDGTIAMASVDTAATAGIHKLEVTTLASGQRVASDPYAAASTVLGSGTLSFQFGKWDGATFTNNGAAKTVAIAANSSVTAVRDAINAAKVGVTASVVNDGTGQRLVIASDNPGASNGFKIGVTDSDGNDTDAAGLSALAYDPAGVANVTSTATAKDAAFSIDGLAMTRSSNVVSDAIAGVTLTLSREAPGTEATITVSRDTDATQAQIEAFVKSYNDTRSMLGKATAYDASTKTGAALHGESVVRIAGDRMRTAIGKPPTGLTGALTSLAQAGVKLKSDGTLEFDATTFKAAQAANPDAIAPLFAASAKQLADALDPILATGSGIASRVDGLSASLKRDATKTEQLQRQYDATEKRIRAQFSALDSLMSRMNSTSSYLTQQLANLPGSGQ